MVLRVIIISLSRMDAQADFYFYCSRDASWFGSYGNLLINLPFMHTFLSLGLRFNKFCEHQE